MGSLQSNNFIFELTNVGLKPEEAIENIENVIYKYDRYSFVKKGNGCRWRKYIRYLENERLSNLQW